MVDAKIREKSSFVLYETFSCINGPYLYNPRWAGGFILACSKCSYAMSVKPKVIIKISLL